MTPEAYNRTKEKFEYLLDELETIRASMGPSSMLDAYGLCVYNAWIYEVPGIDFFILRAGDRCLVSKEDFTSNEDAANFACSKVIALHKQKMAANQLSAAPVVESSPCAVPVPYTVTGVLTREAFDYLFAVIAREQCMNETRLCFQARDDQNAKIMFARHGLYAAKSSMVARRTLYVNLPGKVPTVAITKYRDDRVVIKLECAWLIGDLSVETYAAAAIARCFEVVENSLQATAQGMAVGSLSKLATPSARPAPKSDCGPVTQEMIND